MAVLGIEPANVNVSHMSQNAAAFSIESLLSPSFTTSPNRNRRHISVNQCVHNHYQNVTNTNNKRDNVYQDTGCLKNVSNDMSIDRNYAIQSPRQG